MQLLGARKPWRKALPSLLEMITKLPADVLNIKYRPRQELFIVDMLSGVPINYESLELQEYEVNMSQLLPPSGK